MMKTSADTRCSREPRPASAAPALHGWRRMGFCTVVVSLLVRCTCGASQTAPTRGSSHAAEIVRHAVQSELSANAHDHSRWIYHEVDRKPGKTITQWVAQTPQGDLIRVVSDNGRQISSQTQRASIERSIHDPGTLARRQKASAHDDRQSEAMLKLLPDAFTWSTVGEDGGATRLHFVPNPSFKPPSWQARVFAAMEGDMVVDNHEHRIVSLRGRLTREVRFCGGLFGDLSAGGEFEIERRKISSSVWQIVETHVHMHGTALLFKNISQEEDDVRTRFQQLPDNISMAQYETDLLSK